MRYKWLAVILSIALAVGCVGEVAYAAEPSAEVSTDAELTEDEGNVSGGDAEEFGEGDDADIVERFDISGITLQQGGLLRQFENTQKGTSGEITLPQYDAIDANTFRNAEATLLSAFDSFAEKCNLSQYNIKVEDVNGFISEVLNCNPRYFYVTPYQYISRNGYITEITMKYPYSKSQTQTMLQQYDDAVSQALSGVSVTWSDMEKALYINDYLARNCQYDTTYSNYDAYDVFVKKTAVCQGYALAYLELADKLGIPCELVTSVSLNHAWNMIKINNKYYQVDVTWNDPLTDLVGRAGHYYFMKSTAFFYSNEAGHVKSKDWVVSNNWDEDYATDTSYDSYLWNGMYNGFDYINGYWYSFDGSSHLTAYSCNGQKFEKVKDILTITSTWLSYSHKFVGTGVYNNTLYYSTNDTIYSYNLTTNTSSVIFRLPNEQEAAGSIFGMHIAPTGEVYYLLTTNPNNGGTVYQATKLTGESSNTGITYKVKFNGNGSTAGSMSTVMTCKSDMYYVLPDNAYSRKGYSFAGWNTKADGTGTSYANMGTVVNLSYTDGATVNLYAQWKLTKYSIEYVLPNGADNSKNPSSYCITDEVILKTPAFAGYVFEGWYTDVQCTNKVTKIPKGSTGDITLYAKWRRCIYWILFDGNGESDGYVEEMKCLYNQSYTLPANKFVRKGYTFVGWNTEEDGSGTAYADKSSVKNLTKTHGWVVSLYAQWKKQKYTITYNLNGGKNNSTNPSSYTVTTATVKLKNPTRTGYTFQGWYTDSKYKNKVTQITKGSTGNKKLYAKWTANRYTIKYDGNKSTSGKMSSKTGCKYGTSYTLSKNTFERKGYTFVGWNTKADGSGKSYKDADSVKNLTSKNGATITLYAQWEKTKYTITYKLNGGKNNSKNPSGYMITTATIKLKNPTKKGYTFKGWYTDSKYKNKVTQITKGSTGNKKLYAKWVVNQYTIKFDGNKSTGGKMSDMTNCRYSTSYQLPKNTFKRTGYTFVGWNTKPDGSGMSFDDVANVKKLSSKDGGMVTLYAQWKKK